MNRRTFLKGSAGLALAPYAQAALDGKRRRVGLIGCGWYGKIDLIRLIQVAPVEVVSLCDVDKQHAVGCGRTASSTGRTRRRRRGPTATIGRC